MPCGRPARPGGGRHPATAELNQALGAVAQMANALYPDNKAALFSAGLALSKERKRHTTLEVPGKFQLVDGAQPGTLCAKAKISHSVLATR